jgi:phosphate transport system ATP-binding protein
MTKEAAESAPSRPTTLSQGPGHLYLMPERSTTKVERSGRRVVLEDLHAYYGGNTAVSGVSLEFAANRVTAIIGPSGCGKSTLIRCINRMHEEVAGARVKGQVLLDDFDVYGEGTDPVAVRTAIGMVFQKPNPFPTMSVYDNVASGIRLSGKGRDGMDERVYNALRGAGLWEEVKDRLGKPGTDLSGGQQQRLCTARAIAVEPEVLLMDEPCSALDPGATLRIEELIADLKRRYTIVIVTHNMQQAARVAESTAFLLSGELIEFAPTDKIFTNPDEQRTEDYVTGRFG